MDFYKSPVDDTGNVLSFEEWAQQNFMLEILPDIWISPERETIEKEELEKEYTKSLKAAEIPKENGCF